MDIALIRTFLTVADTGSFVNASARLFVTQSAVSLRVQRLEDNLGKVLFLRSKAGVELTAAGRAFEQYALSMIKLWEEARQQVGVPQGFTSSLIIGAQYSLWPRLGFRWLDALQAARPTLALRAEMGMPDRLTRFLIEGVVQATLTYIAQQRPGLTVVPVMEDELLLLSSFPVDDIGGIGDAYVYTDWGPEFTQAHAVSLPDMTNAGLTLKLEALGVEYIVNRRAAAYVPARSAKRHLDAGRLHLVPGAPVFPYPVWAVFRDDLPDDIRQIALETLTRVADQAEDAQDDVMQALARISEDDISRLGDD
ncbi:LysR family transcriptional regulator [Jannaschia helgolandensis]|uniref:LysR family transcriptional regulator n=1 Tax=Jannaschia helgolandensis TaxID=188906 RepID=UPI0030DC2DB6|tara:strand:- start:1463 stop:2386 length:924 start_codon:yes stop_codon:yes gene_type:complete